MTRAPRVAIVGAGLMGRWHAHASRRAGGRIVRVVDVDIQAAHRLARRLGNPAPAVSLETLPAGVELDIVHICTPLETHNELIRAALARRCSVIVEKPLAPTAAETEALLAEARQAGCWVLPMHQAGSQHGIRQARRWVSSRALRAFDYRACSAGVSTAPLRADDVAADVLPHPLALLDVFVPEALETMAWHVYRPSAGEIAFSGMSGGTAISVLISMHARPPRHELTLFTDTCTVRADLFHGFAWRESGATSRLAKLARPFTAGAAVSITAAVNLVRRALRREPAYPGLMPFVRQAYDSLRQGGPRPLDDRHTLAVARARDSILQRIADA
ncbi:MAG: Gfo/Idh/MocA family protein [Gemmatimonadaceae bacterium]